MESRPKAVLRPSSREKRRNRRRKSKYTGSLYSIPHLTAALMVVLGVGFVLALLRATQADADLALQSVQSDRLSDLNLPGVERGRRIRSAGLLQLAIWAYLFGTPVLFAIQRGLLWRTTRTSFRYVVYSALAVWAVVILVIIATTL